MTAQDVRFFQVFTYVLAGLVGFTVFMFILASIVADNTQRDWRTADPAKLAAVRERIAPIGEVATGSGEVTIEPSASTSLSFTAPPPGAAEETHGEDTEEEASERTAEAADEADEADASDADADGAGAATEALAQTGEEDGAATADEGAMAGTEEGDEAQAATGAEEPPAAEDAAQSGEQVAGGAEEAAAAGGGADAMTADLSGIDGEAIYNQGCNACHAIGAAGAPKLGDGAAWEPRVAKGREVLYDHAINGFNAMPAKGGFTYLSDKEVMAAVNYMLDQL